MYAKLDGTDYYSIRGDVSKTAIKLLWDKAVKASLLASQIDLTATQINMAAENVVITGEKNKGQTIIEGGFLKTALIDVEKLITKKLHIDTDKNTHQDFEAWFDETNGLKINNNGEEIFSIKPSGTAIFSGEIKCAGFQVLNEKYTEHPKKLYEWKKGATGHDCIKKMLSDDCFETLPEDFLFVKNIFYGEGKYGNHTVRVIITEHARNAFGGTHGRALLISNSGEEIGRISSTIDKNDQYNTSITENIEQKTGSFRWQPSLHDFEFYEYRVTQKIRIPNIQFGKPIEKNVLYRDENGFIKIS